MAAGELCPPPDGLDGAAALCRYEGSATSLVTSLKYHHHRDAVDALGAALAVMGGPWLDGATVCWVPAAPQNRRTRGFDQAELLARATVAAASTLVGAQVCAAPLLRREADQVGPADAGVGGAGGQTGRSRAERLVGPLLRPTGRAPANVVVIDDVTTTGSSLSRAAMALRGAGARSVHALCIAATPYGAPPHR